MTTRPIRALMMLPISNFFTEMRKRVFTGCRSNKSRVPLRINSERLDKLVTKRVWKSCWMNWLQPTSKTTSHRDQPAIWSVCPYRTVMKAS